MPQTHTRYHNRFSEKFHPNNHLKHLHYNNFHSNINKYKLNAKNYKPKHKLNKNYNNYNNLSALLLHTYLPNLLHIDYRL